MQWIPTLTLFLFLYPAGWIVSRSFYIFDRGISPNNLSIIGTLISFILFLAVLPSWGSIRWKTNNSWLSIGLAVNNKFTALRIFFSGFIFSVFLIFILCIFCFICGWIDRLDYIKFTELLLSLIHI